MKKAAILFSLVMAWTQTGFSADASLTGDAAAGKNNVAVCGACHGADGNSTVGAWLSDLSLVNHFDDFSKGILDSKHLVYYGCMIFFGLFLTMRSVESLKYR